MSCQAQTPLGKISVGPGMRPGTLIRRGQPEGVLAETYQDCNQGSQGEEMLDHPKLGEACFGNPESTLGGQLTAHIHGHVNGPA